MTPQEMEPKLKAFETLLHFSPQAIKDSRRQELGGIKAELEATIDKASHWLFQYQHLCDLPTDVLVNQDKKFAEGCKRFDGIMALYNKCVSLLEDDQK